jgi:hypothetical protein
MSPSHSPARALPTLHRTARRIGAATLAMLVAACGDGSTPDRSPTLYPVTEPLLTIPTAGWTISVDNPQATTYLFPTNNLTDTAWVTVRDPSGVERFDAWNSIEPDCTNSPGLRCSTPVRLSRTGGFKTGYEVSSVVVNYEGQFRANLRLDNLQLVNSSYFTYRRTGVWTARLHPLSPSATPGSTIQFVDSAFDRWNNYVNFYFPPSFSSATPSVGTINATSGLFTAVDCGTSKIVATHNDGVTPSWRDSMVATVSPCKLNVSVSGPTLVRYEWQCTYTATVTGGQQPYTKLYWYTDGAGLANGLSVSIPINNVNGFIDFWAQDSASPTQNAFGQLNITIDPNAPADPRCS